MLREATHFQRRSSLSMMDTRPEFDLRIQRRGLARSFRPATILLYDNPEKSIISEVADAKIKEI